MTVVCGRVLENRVTNYGSGLWKGAGKPSNQLFQKLEQGWRKATPGACQYR